MTNKIINSAKAPNGGKILSHAILSDSKYRLDISGQIGLDPVSFKLVEGGIETETTQAFENIKNILAEVGWNFLNITKVRVFVTDMNEYSKFNEVYTQIFIGNPPARMIAQVSALPLGASVEIDCVASGDDIS